MAYKDIERFYDRYFKQLPAAEGCRHWQADGAEICGDIKMWPVMDGFRLIYAKVKVSEEAGRKAEGLYEDMVIIHHVLKGGGYVRDSSQRVAFYRTGETLFFSGDFDYEQGATLGDGVAELTLFIERERFAETLRQTFSWCPADMDDYRRRFELNNEILILPPNPLLETKARRLAEQAEAGNLYHVKLESLELLRMDGDFCLQQQMSGARFYPEEYISKVRKIAAFMEDNTEQRLSLDSLSEDFAINKTYLKEIFQELYGLPPMTYFRELRLNRGRRLLEEGLPVLEVALRVGYDNPSKFSAVFKRQFGCLPSHILLKNKLEGR